MQTKISKAVTKAIGELDEIIAKLGELLETENDIFEDKSENWKETGKGQFAADQLNQLETAKDAIESAKYELYNIPLEM